MGGEFGFDYDVRLLMFALADVFRVQSDGSVHVAADDLAFPNGMVLSVDGSELIVGETFGGCYSAYAIGADGHLGLCRMWAQLGDSPPPGPFPEMRQALTFTPDGCCLDADGRIWSADPKGRRLVLLEEGGRVVEEVPAPDGRTFIACMLGGERGRRRSPPSCRCPIITSAGTARCSHRVRRPTAAARDPPRRARRFRAGATDAQIDAFIDAMQAVDVDGMQSISCGRAAGLRPGGWDYAPVADFDDEDAYRRYDEALDHVRFRDELAPPLVMEAARAQSLQPTSSARLPGR